MSVTSSCDIWVGQRTRRVILLVVVMGDDDADQRHIYGVVPTTFPFFILVHFADSRRLYTDRREIAVNLVLEYCWIDNEVVYPKCVRRRCRGYVPVISISKVQLLLIKANVTSQSEGLSILIKRQEEGGVWPLESVALAQSTTSPGLPFSVSWTHRNLFNCSITDAI